MANEFEINVRWRGKEFCFPARVVYLGYIYKIEVHILGTLIIFDKDEDREWRALASHDTLSINNKIDFDLIELVIDSIKSL